MASLEYFVVAESYAVDAETNRVSVFNVIEEMEIRPVRKELQGAQRVLLVPTMAAIGVIRIEAEDYEKEWEAIIRLTVPGHKEPFQSVATFKMRGEATRHRVLTRFDGVPVLEAGVMSIEFLIDGKHMAEHLVTIKEGDAEDTAQPA